MPDPREDLLRRIAEAERRARELQLQSAELAYQAAEQALEAQRLRVDLAGLGPGLPGRSQDGTNRADAMVPAARAHISMGRSRQEHGPEDVPRLIALASAKGHTLRSLATEIERQTGRKTPHTIISRALSGTRRIRKSAADVIARLTGYAATPRHWPGGWADE